MSELKQKILNIRYSRIISDPFPEHSDYERCIDYLKRTRGFWGGIFKFLEPNLPKTPKEISIWEAYKKGYDKAYSEVIERIDCL